MDHESRRGPEVGRFAPSTTGPAHPGTLLAALLCWLDARSRGARVVLRLENLDPERSRPEWVQRMQADLAWLGLDWDATQVQDDAGGAHAAALDRLAERGVLYPCDCSRSEVRAHALPAADGGYRYPNTCRGRALPATGWRAANAPLRAHLPDAAITLIDESGVDLSQDPGAALGDPVVWRRDGVAAYHLASVVDDARAGVTRVVRGRDLATSTATQVALQGLLDLPVPCYRHHLLLLEERGDKLAKLHGAVDADALRGAYDTAALCGVLACASGLQPDVSPVTPARLLPGFTWDRVRSADRVVRWTGDRLEIL